MVTALVPAAPMLHVPSRSHTVFPASSQSRPSGGSRCLSSSSSSSSSSISNNGGVSASRSVRIEGSARGLMAGVSKVAAMLLACRCAFRDRSRRRQSRRPVSVVARRAYLSGPGWTDEVARIFDPRWEGPEWQEDLGYRGRPRIRLLLDGEELVHSYAKALYELTGEWTGPLSAGVEKALDYGGWGGGLPEDPQPDRKPEDPQLMPPEIMTFVAMPSDLIEAVIPGTVCDGYPEKLRKDTGRCLFGEDGFFVNELLRSLQDYNRLITWNRPARLPGGAPRPNALLTQKYWRPNQPVGFRSLRKAPIMLSQAMGAGLTLKPGDEVEALKSGRLQGGRWIPSQWMKAHVINSNYDGTYDLQFVMDFGPVRENRKKGLKGRPQLSLRPNEVYKDWGADTMPAQFRLMQEFSYAQGVHPSNIRQPGSIDRLCDTVDTEGNQDWYICSSKHYYLCVSSLRRTVRRVRRFTSKFQLSYRWVPAGDDLRFEPVPNVTMANALRSHNSVAQQFADAAKADELAFRRMQKYKEEMAEMQKLVETIQPIPEEKPMRPAGPRSIPRAQRPQPYRKADEAPSDEVLEAVSNA